MAACLNARQTLFGETPETLCIKLRQSTDRQSYKIDSLEEIKLNSYIIVYFNSLCHSFGTQL